MFDRVRDSSFIPGKAKEATLRCGRSQHLTAGLRTSMEARWFRHLGPEELVLDADASEWLK